MTAALRFGSVLVANRGEIAIRLLRAARQAGLRTVAVYSDADRDAPHVRAADTAVRLGPPPAADSYLSIPALLDAADRTEAEAIHPGYGFLSERAPFARAVVESGRTFIGPPADVIESMGRKDEARAIAIAADVPVVPALEAAEAADAAEMREQAAERIGLPLLVKAAAGGGGKGMRIVRRLEDLPDALAAARREALAAFGDDTMLTERFIEGGRHVEVQIVADEQGNVVHLYERDCSVQRRHQKVLEESPAPTISAAVRRTLVDAAVRLARQVGYVNAGTVEFLVSGAEVFFLEMNTRLQVEHPVTEWVTGFDIVDLQLSIAQGAPLPFGQPDVFIGGHAIEARVYAEDPYAGFLPVTGVPSVVHWPTHVRVDAALEEGQRIDTWYDPLLGKVIAHGPTREAARGRLLRALDETAILGLTTNVGFLRSLVASDAYRDAEIDTGWLDRQVTPAKPPPPDPALCLAAWALAHDAAGADGRHPFGTADGWRSAGPAAAVPVELAVDERTVVAHVDPGGGRIRAGDSSWQVQPAPAQPGELRLEIDGALHSGRVQVGAQAVTVGYQGAAYVFARPDTFSAHAVAAGSDGTVSAPMPGTVLAVLAATGQRVAAGETLGTMEAMKMELAVTAPYDGTVTDVRAQPGDRVLLGQRLFVVSGDGRPG